MQNAGITASWREDQIDGPAAWSIEPADHVLILHEQGAYSGLQTWLDGVCTSAGEPLPGEVWLVPAGRCYRGTAAAGRVRYIEVTIPEAQLPLPRRARALSGLGHTSIAAMVHDLAGGETSVGEALCLALHDLLGSDKAPQISAATRRRIGHLVTLIHESIEEPLPVALLADAYGTSVNTLISHFAEVTGQTPGQFVLTQRLRQARRHLLKGSLSIAEVAFASGFASHAHLCSAFRSRFGVTPGEWRRRHASV